MANTEITDNDRFAEKKEVHSMTLGILKRLVGKLRMSLELGRYTAHNRADYFRKQGARIGEGCFIVPTRLGTEPYLVTIGNHVAIAQGVRFETHDGGAWIFRKEIPDMQVFGPIVIRDNCVVGENAVIFPNVRIGPNSIVGAGSVVISDVPPDTIVMGIPARPFGSVAKYREKCLERWERQRPPECKIGAGENWWSSCHFNENRDLLREHLLRIFSEEFK